MNESRSPVGPDFKRILNQQQTVILENGSPEDILSFAVNHPDANISALQDAVIERGAVYQVIRFAETVRGADMGVIQEYVLKNGDAYDAYRFARVAPNADIQKLQQFVLDHGTGLDARLFADITGADRIALGNVVHARGTADDIWRFNYDEEIRARSDTKAVKHVVQRDAPIKKPGTR